MKTLRIALVSLLLGAGLCHAMAAGAPEYLRLSMAEYRGKMKAGWIGQMAGVGQGGPTEFQWKGSIIPSAEVPVWRPEMINQFGQDDLYVEMTFLRTLEQHGLDASIRQAGIDFANSGYQLWHANLYGRNNLRAGIAPPDSGHPRFNAHADDIDYQIEADFSGLIAPGMPNLVIELGEKFGRLMNYGDGVYGGQFVGGMYAAAFFTDNLEAIVEAGLACIPAGSQYAECIRDVLQWYREEPVNWKQTWQKIEDKYQENPNYRRFSCDKGDFNIDAKINGAYIVMGLLYGQGDPNETIVISTRCGQDSDCNPSNAAGILFTTLGYERVPRQYVSALDPTGKFSHTPYTFPKLIEVCEQLVREAVVRGGGRIERDATGAETLLIPVQLPRPGALEQSWEPGPTANSRFTEAEMQQITVVSAARRAAEHLHRRLPGWTLAYCGSDMDAPLVHGEWNGRAEVLMIHPQDRTTAAVLSRTVDLPADRPVQLRVLVSHHPQGDWDLVIRVDGQVLRRQTVSRVHAPSGWLEVRQDLAAFAGRKVVLELLNQPTGWSFEAGYFGLIELRPDPGVPAS